MVDKQVILKTAKGQNTYPAIDLPDGLQSAAPKQDASYPMVGQITRFRTAVESALAELEARREEVNQLNVFPVADGDTGDNMVLTLKAVAQELDRLEASGSIEEIGRTEIVDSVARSALLGARGNSGIILSQLIRGAAEELASRRGELIDPVLIGAAMARAADRAYAAVQNPAEGTILTVVREMAHRIASELAHRKFPRLNGTADPALQDQLIAEVLETALEAGERSVEKGPQLLPALKEAGVVDAGGYGLTVIIAGVIAALRGTPPPDLAHHHVPVRVTHPQHTSSSFRYCTNFAVTGCDLDPEHFRQELMQVGDSVLVVGDSTTLKVHIHTDDPDRVQLLFEEFGAVSHLDVADMHQQIGERSQRIAAQPVLPAQTRCGALAVVHGDGIAELYRELGVAVIDGGATLNPSTYDLLVGIHQVPAESVVLLPNSSNVIMAAERAADLSDKDVTVVPTCSQQAGLAIAFALDPAGDLALNVRELSAALKRVKTGAVACAARDDGQGRFQIGDAVGFLNGELTAWGEPQETLRTVLSQLAESTELITCIAGVGAPLSAARVTELAPDGVELEHSDGGQPNYWWLLSAE